MSEDPVHRGHHLHHQDAKQHKPINLQQYDPSVDEDIKSLIERVYTVCQMSDDTR